MKKITLLLVTALLFIGCEIEQSTKKKVIVTEGEDKPIPAVPFTTWEQETQVFKHRVYAQAFT